MQRYRNDFLPSFSTMLAVLWVGNIAAAGAPTTIEVWPAHIELSADAHRQQLIVSGQIDGQWIDLTRDVRLTSSDDSVVAVKDGVVEAVADGETVVQAELSGAPPVQIPVVVRGLGEAAPVDFERDIQPYLTRLGCNAGACHGKQRGQNGFQLSLLGFDSDFDHAALTKEARGRRLFFPDPARSLLLTKPLGEVPHGGGVRLHTDDDAYETLVRWIAAGAPRHIPDTPTLTGIEVFPVDRVLAGQASQQLAVTAIYSDGRRRDVTRMAAFQSSEAAIAEVDDSGLVTGGTVLGEAAIMGRYEGHFAIFRTSVPSPERIDAEFYAQLPTRNFIDEHVRDGLQRLQLRPSAPAGDEKFLRRAYLDVIGLLPTADEARQFLEDPSPGKRDQLILTLLDRPEYGEHWSNKWADLLRPNPYRVGIKTTLNYDHWIRDAFRKNQPYDEFVRELITATGSTFRDGHVTLFRDRRSPDELATIVSQLFLGIRLECAKCHHHPFEVWGQDDFYSFAAYFGSIGRKGTGLSPPISGSEEYVFHGNTVAVKHPLTGEVMAPRPLFGTAPPIPEGGDPRVSLANWMTSPENHYFAEVMANRVWQDLMGPALVEPVDDIRATNPPSNAALLTALGEDFRRSGFDIKQLIHRIMSSHAYGLSSIPNGHNVADTRNYSRHYRQRLRAEVLLDSVGLITGIPESFAGTPPGTSAKSLWTARIDSQFLDAFGRPDPNQDPPCERTSDTTIVQTLHMMNSESMFKKVTGDAGRAAQLAGSELTPEAITEELYLSIYARKPTEEETRNAVALFETDSSQRRIVTEDLMWALLNTPEFLFKD